MIKLYSAVAIVSKNSLDYVERVFEAYRSGTVVIPVKNLREVPDISDIELRECIDPAAKFGWMSSVAPLPHGNELAQVSFTSGTEGTPKGVLLTHAMLSDVTERLNAIMEVNAEIREYIGVPVNYSFGLGRCRAVAEAGGNFYLPEYGFNPIEIRDMLTDQAINSISAVPSLWRVLLRGKDIFGSERLNVRWIEIGSQYMTREEKESLRQLFPRAIIVQHYGLTEASRSTFLRIDSEPVERLESVGKPSGQVQIDVSDRGRIMIKGPHVACQVLARESLVSTVDSAGWYETGDLGRIENGYLYYLGRSDDMINCGGIKISPDAFEKRLRDRLDVKEGLCSARLEDESLGNAILVAYKPEFLTQSADEIRSRALEVAQQFGVTSRSAIRIMPVSQFPETTTGKVKRKELALTYTELHGTEATISDSVNRDAAPSGVLSPSEQVIARTWEKVLGTAIQDPNKNFYDLGGDSLTALSAVIELEQSGVDPRVAKGMLQGFSIREAAKLLSSPQDDTLIQKHRLRTEEAKSTMTINVIRGVLVLCVIFAHWSGGILGRLPESFQILNPLMAPILAIGTPGFAVIYGVSIGYSLFPIFLSDRERFRTIQRKTLTLLAAGITLMGLISFASTTTKVQNLTITDFTNSFFSVLTFYLLATATLGFWFGLLKQFKSTLGYAILAGVASYCLHYYFVFQYSSLKAEGVLELIKLLLTAKYAYFNMFTGTLFGLAIGLGIRESVRSGFKANALLPIGVSCILLGIVVSSHAGDAASWFTWPVSTNYIWRWILYTGVVLVLIDIIGRFIESYNEMSLANRLFCQFLAVIGMLAFPMFILHELVIPMKNVLAAYAALHSSISLAIAMVIFLWPSVILYRKVHRAAFV